MITPELHFTSKFVRLFTRGTDDQFRCVRVGVTFSGERRERPSIPGAAGHGPVFGLRPDAAGSLKSSRRHRCAAFSVDTAHIQPGPWAAADSLEAGPSMEEGRPG